MRRAARAAACLVLATLAPAAVWGQVVSGKAVLALTGAGLEDVTVRLVFPDGRLAGAVVTDSAGAFRIIAPRLGSYALQAERIGLASVTTVPLAVRLSEEVEVVLRMGEEAIPLEPLVVEARSRIELGALAGYYERTERQSVLGFGHILSRDQIEERQALDVADLLLDIPRVRVVQNGAGRLPSIVFLGRGGQCTPKVFVNGIHQNRGGAAGTAAVVDEVVRPHELEGVEVYRGLAETPGEYYDEEHCGVILLWTRRGAEGGGPLNWSRMLAGMLGLLAVTLVIWR